MSEVSGKATLISETMLSSSLNYESDLTYDPDTAMLYWSQISRTEQRIYIINPRTGATIGMYPIGEEGAEVSLLYADSKTALTPPEAVPVDAIVQYHSPVYHGEHFGAHSDGTACQRGCG